MKTIKEVSKIAGISVRTLQYYDKIGLLRPTSHSGIVNNSAVGKPTKLF